MAAYRWRVRAGASSLVLAVTAAGLAFGAPPASADASPVVVQLPPAVRATPRVVSLQGQTTNGHLLFLREADSPGNYEGFSEPMVASLVQPATSTDLSWDTVVVGDRLVRQPLTSDPSAVSSRLLGDDWADTLIPVGYRYLNFSRDGVLLAQGNQGEPQSLAVLPWSGGPVRPLGAVAPGVTVWPKDVRDNDSSEAVIASTTATSKGSHPLVVDTTSSHTWSLGTALPSGCDLDDSMSIHDGAVAWLTRDETGICTAAVPSAAGEPMTVSVRPSPSPSSGSDRCRGTRLLPVGADVLVWCPREDQRWGSGADTPLTAVAQDGTVRVLAPSAGSLVPSSPGHVLAVTGDAPGESSVRDYLVSAGSSTQFLAVAPVPSWSAGLAVDGTRVLDVDDSGDQGAVRQHLVDFGDTTSIDSSVLDTHAQLPVVAGSGAAAWSKVSVQEGAIHLDASGARTAFPVGAGPGMVGTDGRWIAYSHGSLLDTTTGDIRRNPFRFAGPLFQDGVSYDVGSVVPGGRRNIVIATDAATGKASEIPVADCPYDVVDVQVAGSWMLVECSQAAGEDTTQLIDRTGARPAQVVAPAARLYLGNGFLVARTTSGALTWRPAAAPASASWQSLGTAVPLPSAGDTDSAVAVSRSRVPTVAWTTGHAAYVARMPVATSPMPAHPADVAPPTITGASAVGTDASVVAQWDPALPEARITQYDTTARSDVFGTRTDAREYPGSAHAAALGGFLTNGAPYAVQVTAWNIAGSASVTLAATPRPAPAAPTNVKAQLDPATGRVDVTWDHADVPGSEPVSSFSVAPFVGGVSGLSPTARSASFVPSHDFNGVIDVTAHGAAQERTTSVPLTPGPDASPGPSPGPSTDPSTGPVPGTGSAPDSTAPAAAIAALPAASLTGGTTLRLSASDQRGLATRPVDVRWRSAGAGRRLGPWVQPASWQRLPTGNLAVRLADGQTGCFSTRAHDRAGNVSAWTAPRCTSAGLDDRRFSRRGPVRTLSGSGYFRGTASVATRTKAVLSAATLVSDTGWLVASTCSTCGRVQVLVAGRIVATVSLHSAVRRNRVLVPILGSTPRTGLLQLRPARGGQPVTIDGLVLRAH